MWDRPATTMMAGNGQGELPGHGSGSRWGKRRCNAIVISEKAGAILQGFPESWVFRGSSKKARWSQIGQAMPPALAQAVAEAVRRCL
jgi:site-specific DNA-cytosine methylase